MEESSSGSDLDTSTSPTPPNQGEGPPTSSPDSGESSDPSSFGTNYDWRGKDDVVISGISGRLPKSDNIKEFGERILNGEDLVTEDDSRWEPGLWGLPKRSSKLKSLHKFDAQYFGVSPRQANCMDPQVRLLQEVAHEAILDAGLNPVDLRGRRIGVFVGCAASETQDFLALDVEKVEGYTLTGCQRSMFANRLSYSFDFQGPSFAVDTACSSSLLALQIATDAIRSGACEAALVAGAHLTLVPNTSLQFWRLGVLSPTGVCRSFDNNADGYVRGEGVVAIFLQKSNQARRCYATVVHAKSNTDGFKSEGITFPSGDRQATLLYETYREAGVNPNHVKLVEAHGTGTLVGDPLEANAITEALCQKRAASNPLLIGSVKSNMGHSEPASGLASVAKVLVAMESGYIPPSINYDTPNQYIPALVDGRIKVVTEKTPWHGGVVGVNSFGFGGSNTHVILRSFSALRSSSLELEKCSNLPKMLCYSGRTKEMLDTVFDSLEEHRGDPYFYKLLSEQANLPVHGSPFRGCLIYQANDEQSDMNTTRTITKVKVADARPVWFIYSGMGTQWAGMGRELFAVPVFKATILKCSEALRELGMDPYSLIMASFEDEAIFNNTLNCMVCITAIQIALTEVLKKINLSPDGIIGHSMGEMACGYADGSMTMQQAMLCSYYRGNSILNGGLASDGAMAAIGLTWEEAQKGCPDGVYAACHNGQTSVTISGRADKVEQFVEQLKAKEVFAKVVNSSGVPFHTPMMQTIKQELTAKLSKVIPCPLERSSKWISSSIPESDWDGQMARYCSADYQVNNVMSPVLFYEALQKVPANAVTIEIAPHCIMQAILRRNLAAECSHIGLMKVNQTDHLLFTLLALGKIHQAGVNIRVDQLYPTVPYPVPPKTPMIAPLVRWEHTVDWPVINHNDSPLYNSVGGGGGKDLPSCVKFVCDPYVEDSEYGYLVDHKLSSRVVCPFTGYLVFVWRAACMLKGLDYEQTPFICENLSVMRATFLTRAVDIYVVMLQDGRFNLIEGGQICISGTIQLLEEEDERKKPFFYEKKLAESLCDDCEPIVIRRDDIYKEFTTRGYEYGPHFRDLHSACGSGGDWVRVRWTGNWVTFLDAILQAALLAKREYTMLMPIRVRYFRIDPQRHRDAVVRIEDTDIIEMRPDHATHGCISGGIEFYGITPSVQRPKQHSSAVGALSLEKAYFMPQYDAQCLREFPAIRESIGTYRNLLGRFVRNGLLSSLNDKIMGSLPNKEFFKEITDSLMGMDIGEVDEDEVNRAVQDPKAVLLHYFDEVFRTLRSSAQDNQPDILRSTLLSLSDAYIKTVHEAGDRLWTATMGGTARPIRPLLDTMIENSANSSIQRMVVFGLDTPEQIRHIVNLEVSNPLVHVQLTLIGNNVKTLSETALEQLRCKVTTVEADMHSDTVDTLKEAFHTVVLDKVLCRQEDIGRYFARAKQFLHRDGFIVVNEVTSDFDVAFCLHALGSAPLPASGDGSRIYGLYRNHEQWLNTFEEHGFHMVSYQTDPSLCTTAYLIRPIYKVPRDAMIVNVDDLVEFDWVEHVKEKLAHENPNRTIWLFSNSVRDNGVLGLAACLRLENMATNDIRCIADISVNVATRDGPARFQPGDEEIDRLITMDLHMNAYRDGVWGRISPMIVGEDERYQFKETEWAFLMNLVPGDLSSLQWIESCCANFNELPREKSWKIGVLCSVYYAPLNFRDVMAATGRISGDDFADSYLRTWLCPADKDCLLGIEFAGRMYDSGERIMGICAAQSLATVTITKRKYIWSIPDWMSMEEAATLPVAYCTVYYAFLVRGRLRRGESILIHGGSGAVGQAAITVALAHDCVVYTTVGSKAKKDFLQKRFPQLTDQHISNSRSTEFEFDVMKATNGKGVDIVLNSLAGDMLHASLRCMAQHGRFLEIGKYDMAVNSSLGMASLAKNISFHAIFLDQLMHDDDFSHPDWPVVSQMMDEGIKSGVVQPLSRTVFENDKAEDAFRFMATGKHIGKVLVKVRAEVPPSSPRLPMCVSAVARSVCHPLRVYLITGGLGGFGLELANWLFTRGAKRIVLSSRSGVKTTYQQRWLHEWRVNRGLDVHVSTQSIATAEGCTRLLEECSRVMDGAEVGGVFHLAMVLRDQLFEDQTVINFQQAAEAKYHGTRHLDAVTRRLCPKLRWFVVFSSVTSARGNSGQTNYGWANSTMERIVEQRRSDGLPAIAIQWGGIGDVGVIHDVMGGNNETMISGTYPQRIPSCLQTLDQFLSWDYPIVSSFVRADVGDGKGSSGKRGGLILSIARIMGVSDVNQIDKEASLADLGLDSLMGVEIKQVLERDYEIFISPKDIRTLTLAKLEVMAESDAVIGATNEETSKETASDENGDATDSIQLSLETQIETVMAQQFQLRLDVNDIRHYERMIPLNEGKQGKPVIFLHSIEGVATTGLRDLSAKLPFPVYCIQWHPDVNTESMETIADDYIQVLKRNFPTGPYRILGYSYGASVAIALATKLQQLDGPNGIEKFVLLDGSHAYMRAYRDVYRKMLGDLFTDKLLESKYFDAHILCIFVGRMNVDVNLAELRKVLLTLDSWEQRLDYVVNEVVNKHSSGVHFDDSSILRHAAEGIRRRLICADAFVPNAKLQGDAWLIRSDQEVQSISVPTDYGLADIVSGSVHVCMVAGAHDEIVHGSSSAKTAELLTEIMTE